ncbi:MAG: hypothetical protein JWP03_2094 [Phycisphaerales bacterium]|jgi:hypothetical protein|nr:hypothetical protein [Phycisphaerales bacterium]
MDGRGLPPRDIRDAIISEEGEWELRVPDAAAPKTCITKLLRKEQSLSLAQAAALIQTMPGVVACGTIAEMELLAHLIHVECGYTAEVTLGKESLE